MWPNRSRGSNHLSRDGNPQTVVIGLVAAALAHTALGQRDRASALLAEIEANPGSRETHFYAPYLPAMVNAALALDNPELADGSLRGSSPGLPYPVTP